MNETALIEDIITTKNTLTILNRVFIANESSLKQFSSVFALIRDLLDILTHSSATQIQAALQPTGSKSFFDKLKETLNELSDAITTKNTAAINSFNKQLESCIQTLRVCPPAVGAIHHKETADDVFKKQLQQSKIDNEDESDFPEMPVSLLENESEITPSASKAKEIEEKAPVSDPFAYFRFARRPRRSDPSEAEEDEHDAEPQLPVPYHPTKSSTDKPRLMISYNHASKPVCLDIYNGLTKDGYTVWIDLKEMHGSTLAAMAQAVEDSDIILYCVTEKYSQSPNCQKEAEYAFVQQKIMIPLLLQSKYKPRGWLGLLMGAGFYIDFTKNDFTQNYGILKSEIEANAKRLNSNQNEGSKLILHSSANSEEDNQKVVDNSSIQPLQAKSTVSVPKSRGCVLV